MYPLDRRTLALHVYTLFFSLRKTANVLQVSHMTISRWISNPERKNMLERQFHYLYRSLRQYVSNKIRSIYIGF